MRYSCRNVRKEQKRKKRAKRQKRITCILQESQCNSNLDIILSKKNLDINCGRDCSLKHWSKEYIEIINTQMLRFRLNAVGNLRSYAVGELGVV